jgi:hypothetical protein
LTWHHTIDDDCKEHQHTLIAIGSVDGDGIDDDVTGDGSDGDEGRRGGVLDWCVCWV